MPHADEPRWNRAPAEVYVLDTDTLTRLHAGDPKVVARLRDVADSRVVTTVITKIELLRGRFDFLLKAANGAQLLRVVTRNHQDFRRVPDLALENWVD